MSCKTYVRLTPNIQGTDLEGNDISILTLCFARHFLDIGAEWYFLGNNFNASHFCCCWFHVIPYSISWLDGF